MAAGLRLKSTALRREKNKQSNAVSGCNRRAPFPRETNVTRSRGRQRWSNDMAFGAVTTGAGVLANKFAGRGMQSLACLRAVSEGGRSECSRHNCRAEGACARRSEAKVNQAGHPLHAIGRRPQRGSSARCCEVATCSELATQKFNCYRTVGAAGGDVSERSCVEPPTDVRPMLDSRCF